MSLDLKLNKLNTKIWLKNDEFVSNHFRQIQKRITNYSLNKTNNVILLMKTKLETPQ